MGNQNSGRKDKYTRDALVLEMKAREKGADKKGLRIVSQKVWDLAEGGERWAVEFIRDTLDGKPAQQVNLADADGEKIEFFSGVPRAK